MARFRSPEIEIDEEVPVPQVPEIIPLALLEKVKARLNHNRTFNRHDLKSYILSGFIRCGNCGKALSGQTPHKKIVYRHKPANGCTICSVRGNEVEAAVLDYLHNAFLDEDAFNKAVERAMPSADLRKDLLEKATKATKRLAKTEREIERLVDAIAKGADPGLLLSKQGELKTERDALTRRLEELDHEIAAVPSVEHTQAASMLARLLLTEECKGKDWRKLPFEDVKRFLFHLFGETTLRNGNGIFVEKDSKRQTVVTFKGRVDFHHLITNGRPVSRAMQTEATTMNARIRREFERAVQSADEEYRRVLDELKPYTDNQ